MKKILKRERSFSGNNIFCAFLTQLNVTAPPNHPQIYCHLVQIGPLGMFYWRNLLHFSVVTTFAGNEIKQNETAI
jgi:hypothetical protein